MSAENSERSELKERSQKLAQELLEAMQRPGVDPERSAYEEQKELDDRAALADYYRRTGQSQDNRPPGPPVPLRSFGFECVQGLWGGCALWAAEDRSAIIQIVDAGLWEKRYRIRIAEEQWAEIERLAGAHPFLRPETRDRNGLPDEARPAILLVTRTGEAVCAARWANDSHPDFDAIYNHLRSLCRDDGVLVREGLYERLWPEGIESPIRHHPPG